MKNKVTLFIAALLVYSSPLLAGEKSGENIKAPDPAAFGDLLKAAESPGRKSGQPLGSAARPGEDTEEIGRILAEARMHLSRIADDSASCSEDARHVFDEAIELITFRLQHLKEKAGRKQEELKKTPPGAAKGGGGVKGRPGLQADRAEAVAKASTAPLLKHGRARSEGVRSRSKMLNRWADHLRKLADELEAEADAAGSTGAKALERERHP